MPTKQQAAGTELGVSAWPRTVTAWSWRWRSRSSVSKALQCECGASDAPCHESESRATSGEAVRVSSNSQVLLRPSEQNVQRAKAPGRSRTWPGGGQKPLSGLVD